jgi:hypothetical protein
MKLKFVPSVTADTSFNYVAGYVFHDASRVSLSGLTIATAVSYESRKIGNVARPWKYYRKLIRDIDPTVKQTNQGYITTAAPTASQLFCLFLIVPTALASKTFGYIMVTNYVSAFARQ